MSVSPRTTSPAPAAGPRRSSSNGARPGPGLVDTGAFTEIAATLRELIDQAARSEEALRRLLDQSGGVENRTGQASILLQERLRLGARMVKAFQSQIARVEASLERIDERQAAADRMLARVDDRISTFEQRAEHVMGSLQTRLDRMVQDAVDRFEDQARGASEEMSELEERMGETGASIDDLKADVQAARGELRHGEQRVQEVIALADQAASNLDGSMQRGDAIEKRLAEAVAQAEARLERSVGDARDLAASIETRLDLAQTVGARLEHAADRADLAQAEIPSLNKGAQRIEDALNALKPWRSMLLDVDGQDNLTRSADQLASTFTRRIGAPVAELASTLRDLASRLDHAVPATEDEDRAQPQITIIGPGVNRSPGVDRGSG